MINASHEHLNLAQVSEAPEELDEALREYRRASGLRSREQALAAKVTEIERRVRDQNEAQPRNNIAQLREQARQAGPPPLIKVTEVLPGIRFTNTSIRDILNSIAAVTGVNVTYDRDYQDRPYRGGARRRHTRAGAEPDPVGESIVLQGGERTHHPGDRGQPAEARELRRAGDSHLLHLAL